MAYLGPSIHYAEVGKLGSKWSRLNNYFSTDFCTKDTQSLTKMSKLPKNLKKKYEKLKIEEDARGKRGKNPVGVFSQDKLGAEKIV